MPGPNRSLQGLKAGRFQTNPYADEAIQEAATVAARQPRPSNALREVPRWEQNVYKTLNTAGEVAEGFLMGDPTSPIDPKETWGYGAGMALAAAPFGGPKSLGTGIKGLYSRLNKAIGNLPTSTTARNALNQLKKFSHPEEIAYTGVGKMLEGASGPVTRQAVEETASARPLQLETKVYGEPYGHDSPMPESPTEQYPLYYKDTPTEVPWSDKQLPGFIPGSDRVTLLKMPGKELDSDPHLKFLDEHENRFGTMTQDGPNGDFEIIRPGGAQVLGTYPLDQATAIYNHNLAEAGYTREQMQEAWDAGMRDIDALNAEWKQANPTFHSNHYPNDPNTITSIRHNERYLPADRRSWEAKDFESLGNTTGPWKFNVRGEATPFMGIGANENEALQEIIDGFNTLDTAPPGPKIRMIENLQSELHQTGAQVGYGSPIPPTPEELAVVKRINEINSEDNDIYRRIANYRDSIADSLDGPGYGFELSDRPNYHPGLDAQWREFAAPLHAQREALEAEKMGLTNQLPEQYFGPERVPDFPFKDNKWADLGLKQQIMDVAARPDIEGIGIAPGSELMKRGELNNPQFQDQLLPAKLGKILAPFGGKMERVGTGLQETDRFTYRGVGEVGGEAGEAVASLWPRWRGQTDPAHPNRYLTYEKRGHELAESVQATYDQLPHEVQAWIARFPPEVRARLLKDGLSLMSLYGLMQAGQQDPAQ